MADYNEAIKNLQTIQGMPLTIRLAIEALEKQIQKKVKYKNRHGDGADLWNLDYYNCPACGRRLRNKQHDPYCGRCGQALDWGDI